MILEIVKTQVVAAIIVKEDKFLLGKRALTKKSGPGYWSPISGRIELGESEEEAVRREVFEEVNLEVIPVRKITEFDTHDKRARIHWWLVKVINGEPILKNDEHFELGWFSILEMQKLDNIFLEDIELFKTLG